MDRDPDPESERAGLHRPHASAALVVSVQSVVWTVLSSTVAIALGVTSGTAVLVAFGAVGFVDAIGSVALAYHFHHGLRHDELSDRIEALAHRIVLVGLLLVGSASVAGGIVRLATHESSDVPNAAVVLAGLSLAVLVVLARRKRNIARAVGSAALLSDAHLSGVGASQAAVALAGTALAHGFGWHSADAVATAVVGSVAVTLAVVTMRRRA